MLGRGSYYLNHIHVEDIERKYYYIYSKLCVLHCSSLWYKGFVSGLHWCFCASNQSVMLVTQVALSSLNLDKHARQKMIKLVGERYCKDTDVLTITTDR